MPDPVPLKRKIGTIDLTPKWADIMPAIIDALEYGAEPARKAARDMLAQLAAFADQCNAEKG